VVGFSHWHLGTMAVEVEPELEKRLREEKIAWLTTVRRDGMPQPTPVWFLWQNGRFLIYSQPEAKKIRNIENNPRVAISLNSDLWGNHIAVVTGMASVDFDATPANEIPAYLAKYHEGILQIEMTPESMAKEYSAAIHVTPVWVRHE
jgi:PPOX class probable F420-dependent enzyme